MTTLTAFAMLRAFSPAYAHANRTKLAPFSDPKGESLAVTDNGMMYVMGGFVPAGIGSGIVREYAPFSDQRTKKKNMSLPAHHMAMAKYRGEISVIGEK